VALSRNFSFSPTVVWVGKRYAYTTAEDYTPIATNLRPYTLANVFFNYKNLVPGLTLGAGVYDLFNTRPAMPQGYNGGLGAYAPIPGASREFVVKLSYQVNFKK
jgi:outer membrane receptor protein involved in Fe transport